MSLMSGLALRSTRGPFSDRTGQLFRGHLEDGTYGSETREQCGARDDHCGATRVWEQEPPVPFPLSFRIPDFGPKTPCARAADLKPPKDSDDRTWTTTQGGHRTARCAFWSLSGKPMSSGPMVTVPTGVTSR